MRPLFYCVVYTGFANLIISWSNASCFTLPNIILTHCFTQYTHIIQALDKRGQTLGAIERQTVKLEDGAATFCSDAEKLVLKMQGKKASKGDKKKSKLKKLTLKHN